ncbi:2Fe-2S iron-sulfur cluster binding domain-containing protein [Skermania sp. ID1734]|uniref:diiron oxygenase n=1 Tax=Skermania sp. ID1734 TaxID=2597516 RepID=UPI00117D889A|nr:diiron oxygenase [Skermania sp. ID1734]TSD96594.1 2Fe-2S iron-sulfur cluster binding domain-containing protein [Skermania sp. ID1734]
MTGVDARFTASEKISSRLLKSALKQSYDPWTDIDWDAPLVENAPFLPLHRSTLYGTDLWDEMTPEQRVQLTRHESASIASSGIWFEMILMQLVLRAAYDMDPRTAHMHWALTEIADECHHSIMFGKALARTGMPPHRHSKMFNELGRIFKSITWGPSSYAAILVAEEILDEAQREMMTDETVEPLVRRVSQIHVTEEARHIRFAREQIADMMSQGMDPAELLAQQTLCAVVAFAIVESLISPGVYAAGGLDSKRAVAAARNNPNMHKTRAEWGKKVVEFLAENNLIGGPAAGLWRASHLMSEADVERGLIGRTVDTGTATALKAAAGVLPNIPGLRKLARGTLAGIGSGPGKQPKPDAEPKSSSSLSITDPVRAIAESAPAQALRRATDFLPWGLIGDPLAPSKRPRKKPESSKSVHRLAVADIQRLTSDSVAVTFDVPDDLRDTFRYIQGQHITIEAMVNGEKVRRSYSVCAPVSAQTLRVGVKKVADGVFSSYVVDTLQIGDEVDVVPPAGRFYTELDSVNALHYVGLAGGSGITPILSILASVLEEEPNSRFTLWYANRDRDSVMFFDEIAELHQRYGDRFTVLHILEDGGHSGSGFANGRIDAERLSTLAESGDVAHWFLCGPAPMTEGAREALRAKGVDDQAIHLELFNTIGLVPAATQAQPAQEAEVAAGAQLRFSFEGADEAIDMRDGELLLDAALRTGQDIPWSCREAVCGMCRAKLCEGQATPMMENHALTPNEVDAGYILTCQTRAASKKLRLDFDD